MREAFDLSLVLYTEHELQRLDLLGAGHRLDALGHLLRASWPPSAPSRARSTAAPTRRRGRSWSRSARPRTPSAGSRRPWPARSGSWASATGSTRPATPAPRILKEHCIALAKEVGDDRWERIAEPIEQAVTSQKNLPPNVDWPSARLYHYMGLEIDLYTPIFAMARVAGWAAHIIEQLDHNRLMRPRARYTGPPHRSVKPIDQR